MVVDADVVDADVVDADVVDADVVDADEIFTSTVALSWSWTPKFKMPTPWPKF